MKISHISALALLAANLAWACSSAHAAEAMEMLNVSYDSTRDLYSEINDTFLSAWADQGGGPLKIRQSHGGAVKQVNAVLSGIEADVVTLGSASDVDVLAKSGHLLSADWRTRLPHSAVPYTSAPVLLVRKGNPKEIRDWADLARPGIVVVTADPRTSGGGRWNFLSLYAYGLAQNGNDQDKALEFVAKVYKNTPDMDFSVRSSGVTFQLRQKGDALITWENEALSAAHENSNLYEVVAPSMTMRAEPAVAVVDVNTRKHGTEHAATAYLQFLYTPAGQKIIAKHYFRAWNPEVAAKYADQFPKFKLINVNDIGGWATLQKEFDGGGKFAAIYGSR